VPANQTRFEAAFPFASEKEKETERSYIEKHFQPISHDFVKGVWITSRMALSLARDYEIEQYIQALMDAAPNKPSDGLVSSEEVRGETNAVEAPATTPTVSKIEPEATPRRARRSTSPRKRARTPKAPSSTTSRGRRSKKSIGDDESIQSSIATIPEATLVKSEQVVQKSIDVPADDKPFLDTIDVKV
jgi:hypothetical protein